MLKSLFSYLFLFICCTWACDPIFFYPAVNDIQLLSSDQNQALLTIINEDQSTFCVVFEANASNIDVSSYGESMVCSNYADDIVTFTSDEDTSATQVNSITAAQGIDITRGSQTILIPFAEIPNVTDSTVSSSDVNSFTLDGTLTCFAFAGQNYAIQWDTAQSNSYSVYLLSTNIEFDLDSDDSNVATYTQYDLLSYIDPTDSCSMVTLYEYEITFDAPNQLCQLTLDEIFTDWNMQIDSRSNYAFAWGYSASFQIFNVNDGAIYQQRYGDAYDYGSSSASFQIYGAYTACACILAIMNCFV